MNVHAIHSETPGGTQMAHARSAARINGISIGALGGVVGTFVMDLVLMGTLSAAGMPALTCFSIVGDTVARFFSILGVEMAGGISAGVATHYVVGPVVGAIFGAAVARVAALRVDTLNKSVVLAVLYVEILSQSILATTPILLKMTPDDTLQWFGVSFVMHLVYGGVLGTVVSRFRSSSHSARI